MVYYEPMILERAPLLGFTCCAMSDAELRALGRENDTLVIRQTDLEKFVQQRHGVCIYTIRDGAYVLRGEAEFEPYARMEAVREKCGHIAVLKAELLASDWYVLKCAELGIPMPEAYPGVHSARTGARAEINRLEAEINEMETIKFE